MKSGRATAAAAAVRRTQTVRVTHGGQVVNVRSRGISGPRPITGSRSIIASAPRLPAFVIKAADKLARQNAKSPANPIQPTEAADSPRAKLLAALLTADRQGLLQEEQIRTAAARIGLAVKWGDPVPPDELAVVAAVVPCIRELMMLVS